MREEQWMPFSERTLQAHTHGCRYTHMHTDRHTCTHTYTQAHTHRYRYHTCTHTGTHSWMHRYHTHAHRQTHIHTHAHQGTHTQMHSYHTPTHVHTHTHTHRCTAPTHMHTDNVHTHIHTVEFSAMNRILTPTPFCCFLYHSESTDVALLTGQPEKSKAQNASVRICPSSQKRGPGHLQYLEVFSPLGEP